MEDTLKPVAVDLFCGAGGLSYGMNRAGVEILAGFDIDPACRYPFEKNINATFYQMDVAELSADFVADIFANAHTRVLAGCAPCQPFSSYTNRKTARRRQWQLLSNFATLIEHLRPEIITMENVPRLIGHTVFEDFLASLDGARFRYWFDVVRCADYGVPQTRRRLVLLASRLDDITLIPPTHARQEYATVADVIQHMETIPAGGESISDPIHRSSSLSPINTQRIKQSKPGGTWSDWDSDLLAECHTRETGRSYRSVYGRMRWDAPAPTITTQFNGYGNGRFGHPTQDRAISLREGAMLQTFPPDYSFARPEKTVNMSSVARLVGNAVPVHLGEAIGRSIVSHAEEFYARQPHA